MRSVPRWSSGRGARRALRRWRCGLLDELRPGRPRTVTDEQVEQVIVKTVETTPHNATHWSTRSMAAEVGLTQNAVLRTWQAFGL